MEFTLNIFNKSPAICLTAGEQSLCINSKNFANPLLFVTDSWAIWLRNKQHKLHKIVTACSVATLETFNNFFTIAWTQFSSSQIAVLPSLTDETISRSFIIFSIIVTLGSESDNIFPSNLTDPSCTILNLIRFGIDILIKQDSAASIASGLGLELMILNSWSNTPSCSAMKTLDSVSTASKSKTLTDEILDSRLPFCSKISIDAIKSLCKTDLTNTTISANSSSIKPHSLTIFSDKQTFSVCFPRITKRSCKNPSLEAKSFRFCSDSRANKFSFVMDRNKLSPFDARLFFTCWTSSRACSCVIEFDSVLDVSDSVFDRVRAESDQIWMRRWRVWLGTKSLLVSTWKKLINVINKTTS